MINDNSLRLFHLVSFKMTQFAQLELTISQFAAIHRLTLCSAKVTQGGSSPSSIYENYEPQ